MNPDRQQTIEYLRSPGAGLWRWTENGTVLVWHDGSTVAFREEIVAILEWLAPNGLPSFGAIVFLLAACRGKVPRVAEILTESKVQVPTDLGPKAALLSTARRQLAAQLEVALGELARVSRLPAELNSGLKAKCVLAEAVFEPAKGERFVEARAVLRGLREPFTDADLAEPETSGVSGSYIRQVHIVAEGLKLHTAESLALRLRTGLDVLPKEIDASLPPAERARQLIDELSRDREIGAVARAARGLMAAVRLPRRLGEREQLAVGGVADITNRGPLDRLLLSELAHDDLTLAARVALNEALYLRREPPMREPPGTLALLLDSGVRLWGVPRVLATAVALALVARDKKYGEVLAWRAHGRQLQSVDLLARNGLTQHLSALETHAHPGESLPAFAEAISSGAQNQSVLITHRDALDDPGFRRALADHPAAPGFVAVVDREGRFELHALPLTRRPPVCEADLDLASVFDEKTGVPPIKGDIDPDLPAIFGVTPFPFLLPISGKVDYWIKEGDGITYAVLNNRQLVQFRGHQAGARVLANDLPGGRTAWLSCVENTVHLVKAGASQRPTRLLSLPLPDGPLRVIDLVSGSDLQAVHRSGDVILVIRRHDVRAYSLNDGKLLGRTINPHQWVHGRYLRGQSHFYFAVWDGERVKFERVTLPNGCEPSLVPIIFDRQHVEGPWVLHTHGNVISSANSEKIRVPMITGFAFAAYAVSVSRDGNRLHIGMPDPPWDCLFDLQTGQAKNNPQLLHPELTLDPLPRLPTWNLYSLIESIARLPVGIALCGRKGRWRKLSLHTNGKIRIAPLPTNETVPSERASLPALPKPNRHGCLLQVARWPGGSQAFLDSRGLLHLKSHDPDVPEVSLVLSDGEVAGWTSDGYVCGPAFFFGGQFTSEPIRVFERILRFLHHL